MRSFSLNINGQLHEYNSPRVMGILNVTPDSFHAESRALTEYDIERKVEQMISEDADFIDIGAYSTRPGCVKISADEELRRLELGMKTLRRVAPNAIVSVDTFRANVAREAVTNLSVNIVNDISGGSMDPSMGETIADLHVPYVLMHMRGTPQTMMQHTEYEDVIIEVLREISEKVARLNLLGVNDIIIDPGFGFSKTLEQNYMVFKNLPIFQGFKMPILVGISRKSMLTRLLNIEACDALQATTALNMAALQRGVSILRVHDVAAAKQAVAIYNQLNA